MVNGVLFFPQIHSDSCDIPQLYESFGEGLVLFFLLFWINKVTKIRGVVCSSFLIFYGLIRFSIEFFRQPDSISDTSFGLIKYGADSLCSYDSNWIYNVILFKEKCMKAYLIYCNIF